MGSYGINNWFNFVKEIDSSKLAFQWLIDNQNSDGSWYAKYNDIRPIEKNKPTHFGPYISVATLHFYKSFLNKEFLGGALANN